MSLDSETPRRVEAMDSSLFSLLSLLKPLGSHRDNLLPCHTDQPNQVTSHLPAVLFIYPEPKLMQAVGKEKAFLIISWAARYILTGESNPLIPTTKAPPLFIFV
jgi:hypothetical protein